MEIKKTKMKKVQQKRREFGESVIYIVNLHARG